MTESKSRWGAHSAAPSFRFKCCLAVGGSERWGSRPRGVVEVRDAVKGWRWGVLMHSHNTGPARGKGKGARWGVLMHSHHTEPVKGKEVESEWTGTVHRLKSLGIERADTGGTEQH